jgi:RNA polymerase sigma factor (TIGR02999 family)
VSLSGQVTELLRQWRGGDDAALAQLTPLVYGEMRRLAGRYLGAERTGHTLQATALVHEAFLELVDQKQVDWQGRAHFLRVAAQIMRHILIDYARRHRAAKRGSGDPPVTLDESAVFSPDRAAGLVALDDALQGLEAIDPRKSKVVELRYFGGLTVEETAEALGVSAGTVRRDSALAEAWLHREMTNPLGT